MCDRPDLTPFEKHVAGKVQRLRKVRKISVPTMIQRLADAGLKVAVATYYQWEKADRPISLANLATIANVLDTNVSMLVDPSRAVRRKK